MGKSVTPTGKEVFFRDDEIIVSKTDINGRITYANELFMKIAGYSEEEVIGSPHSMIRHPDMPRAVFKLMWDTISSGHELFAYVVNFCKNGDHYWVYAHVTPTFNSNREIIGYHSNRRVPERHAVERIQNIYRALKTEEDRHSDPRVGLQSSYQTLVTVLEEAKKPYEEYIWTVAQ